MYRVHDGAGCLLGSLSIELCHNPLRWGTKRKRAPQLIVLKFKIFFFFFWLNYYGLRFGLWKYVPIISIITIFVVVNKIIKTWLEPKFCCFSKDKILKYTFHLKNLVQTQFSFSNLLKKLEICFFSNFRNMDFVFMSIYSRAYNIHDRLECWHGTFTSWDSLIDINLRVIVNVHYLLHTLYT